MGLVEFTGLIRRRWRIVVACLLLGLIGAAVVSSLVRPTYRSSARVFVGTCAEGSIDQAYQCSMFTKDRALSYASLVASGVLAQRVVDDLHLTEPASDLNPRITAKVQPETSLIQIDVVDEDPARAKELANSAARQFVRMVASVELPQSGRPGNPFTNLTVVDSAQQPPVEAGTSAPVNLGLGALAGLLVGVIAAMVRDRFDTAVRGTGQVAEAGLVLLGTAPRRAGGTVWAAGDGRVESFRRLSSAMGVPADQPGRVVAFVAPTEGAGAGQSALDFARAQVETGARVVLVDADMTGRSTTGVPESDHGLAELLVTGGSRNDDGEFVDWWGEQGEAAFDPVTVNGFLQVHGNPPVKVISPGRLPDGQVAGVLLASGRFADLLDALRKSFDEVVVHSAPILTLADAAMIARSVDAFVFVVAQDETTTREVEESVRIVRSAGGSVRGVLLVTGRGSGRTARAR